MEGRTGRARLPPAAWQALAWCAALGYPVALLVALLNAPPEHPAAGVALAAVLALLPAALLPRRPLPAVLSLLTGTVVAATSTPSDLDIDWQLGYLQIAVVSFAVGCVAAVRPLRFAAGVGLLSAVVLVGASSYYTSGTDQFTAAVAFVVAALAAAGVIGHSVRVRRVHARQLRAQITETAVAAERLRIAREVHDQVAHSIGVIAIQAGTARRVIDRQPAEATAALAAIEATSRDTLAELRRMVGALRQGPAPLGPAPGLADLDRLVTRTGEAGVRVEVVRRGAAYRLPAAVDQAAFRIVQEAVTNVVRHSGADRCQVVIDYRDGDLAVAVTDDGRGAADPGTGYGITGMRERVSLLAGEFSAGPRPEGGFQVAARFPVAAG